MQCEYLRSRLIIDGTTIEMSLLPGRCWINSIDSVPVTSPRLNIVGLLSWSIWLNESLKYTAK
jgi:hypothetical protein